MEKAFHDFAWQRIADGSVPSQEGWTLARNYGLRPDLLAVTHAWRPDAQKDVFTVAAKGAPETIADLCRLGDADRATVKQAVDAMAALGLRVLGVAKATHHGDAFPETPRRFTFALLGLVGLADPLRPSVPQAVGKCPASASS